jgi:hypothetical protein
MGNNWEIYVLVLAVAGFLNARLDRLGNQLEAVCVSIRADVARTEENRDEILSEWKETKAAAAKEKRNSWIIWAMVGTAVVIWSMISRQV